MSSPTRTPGTGIRNQKRQLLGLLLAADAGGAADTRAIRRRGDRHEYPLSFAQQRLWLLDQIEPGPHYNDPFHLRLKGPLDPGALQRGLGEITRRHEALRARFGMVDGRPEQRIQPPSVTPLPVVDLSWLTPAEQERQAAKLAYEQSREEFDLRQGPLFRCKLLRLGAAEHLLLMTFHHIAMDGWSRAVFLKELAVLHQAYRERKESPLPEPAIQYADYAAWQRERMQGEELERHLRYWREQLRGAPALLEWPTDFPRPARQSFRGARLEVNLEAGLTGRLARLSQDEGCTLFMTLLTAFKILALRYTGQEDLVIGSAVANRNRSEIEGLIGYFLNTLVLRADFSGEPTFREALRRVQQTALGAYAHQDLPYERLVEALNPGRDPSYNAIFQVMFLFQNTPKPDLSGAGLEAAAWEAHNGTAKFDLTLNLSENQGGLSGWLEYATDLFTAESMNRLRGHFQTLLESAAREPDRRITRLPMLTGAETRRLAEWNDTRRPRPADSCVHEWIERQALRTPEAIAVACGGAQLTYRELNANAEELAGQLRSLGVGPETVVGILLERSVEMVAAVLAVWKAGGAYSPLDLLLPTGRLEFILEDAGVSVLITNTGGLKAVSGLSRVGRHGFAIHRAQGAAGAGLLLADLGGKSSTDAAGRPAKPGPEGLAYVIHTSGSTGKPKGVEIPHRAVVNAFASFQVAPGIAASDTLLAVTTLSFDIAVLELFLPLTVGAKVVMVTREEAMNGVQLARELERWGVTMMQATPAMWRMLLAAGWKGNPDLKILCGGEAWPVELARQLLGRCASLWNLYGPTETTIWSAVQQVGEDARVVIGRPMANTRFYVVDRRLQLVPAGIAGELCIAGDGLARGYRNRPELTAEKFVERPFGPEGEARLYRTGDLVKWRADGRLEFLGRMDHQVKVRGYRIETGEVESVLAEHPSVRECVVIARQDASGENQLAAYLVAGPGRNVETAELRRHLVSRLPDYMMPAVFVLLPELPRTPNGKVDRSGLPAPLVSVSAPEPGAEVRLTPVQAALAEIWREVLGADRVGLSDNFFDLGGHSLLVTQAIARIRQRLQVEYPMRAFFESPTIAAMADRIERNGGRAL